MTKRWTILFYMNCVDTPDAHSREKYGIDLIERLQAVVTPAVQLLIQIDRGKKGSMRYSNWTGARRFELTADTDLNSPGEELGDVIMCHQETLDTFLHWAKAQSKGAENRMLVLWDHGDSRYLTGNEGMQEKMTVLHAEKPHRGWIEDFPILRKEFIKYLSTPHERREARAKESFLIDKISFDHAFLDAKVATASSLSASPAIGLFKQKVETAVGTDMQILSMKSVAASLSKTFGENKIDVLALDACDMANIETAYALRDVCHSLIATEYWMHLFGLGYDALIAEMAVNADLSAKQIAERLQVAYVAAVLRYTHGTDDDAQMDKEYFTYSAIDMALIEQTAVGFDQLLKAIQQHYPTTDLRKVFFAAVRAAIREFDKDIQNVDMALLVEKIRAAADTARIKEQCNELLQLISRAIIYNRVPAMPAILKLGGNGLAIFFPSSHTAFHNTSLDIIYTPQIAAEFLEYEIPFATDMQWSRILAEVLL